MYRKKFQKIVSFVAMLSLLTTQTGFASVVVSDSANNDCLSPRSAMNKLLSLFGANNSKEDLAQAFTQMSALDRSGYQSLIDLIKEEGADFVSEYVSEADALNYKYLIDVLSDEVVLNNEAVVEAIIDLSLSGKSYLLAQYNENVMQYEKEAFMQCILSARDNEATKGELIYDKDTKYLQQTGVEIKFGTSGWRGQVGKNFVLPNIKRAVQGIAEYYKNNIKEGYILVGYDPRKDNAEFVKETAAVLAANGIQVKLIASEPTPTPVLAYLANNNDDIAGVINFTASHNPAIDDGIKFSPYHGGAADKDATDAIAKFANGTKTFKTMDYADAVDSKLIEEVDYTSAVDEYVNGYLIPTMKEIGAWDDIVNYIKSDSSFKVVIDAMQGTGSKYLESLYSSIAKEVGRDFYTLIHTNNTDPSFSDVNGAPNPTLDASIKELLEQVLAGDNTLGLGVDGDADRFGVVENDGTPITSNDMMALCTYFFSEELGMKGLVGKTVATTNFVNAVAEYCDLEVVETAVGFKNFVEQVVKYGKEFIVAGEESAHVAVGPFMKSWDDGPAVATMALWIKARTGMSLVEYKAAIEEKIGKKFFIKTSTFRGKDDSIKEVVNGIIADTKAELESGVAKADTVIAKQLAEAYGQPVVDMITLDGVKVVFESGDWLLFRPSGTEPAVKIYAEVTDKANYQTLLGIGMNVAKIDGEPAPFDSAVVAESTLTSAEEKQSASDLEVKLTTPLDAKQLSTLENMDLSGKQVLVRVDFNVPIQDGKITDTTRITAALPTIQYLLDKGCKIVLCSHRGRPKGKVNKDFTLAPVAAELSALLMQDVKFVSDSVGSKVKKISKSLKAGEILLLENLRFYAQEEANDTEFAKELIEDSGAEAFINDAFGTAHRAHASTHGVAQLVPSGAGFLMEKEVEYLENVLDNPIRPLTVIVGGSKVASKISVFENLINNKMQAGDNIVVAGGIAYTFLQAAGGDLSNSINKEDTGLLPLATKFMEMAKAKGINVILPEDVMATDKFSFNPDEVNAKYFDFADKVFVDNEHIAVDLGPKSIKSFNNVLQNSSTVIWNGPVGVFENEKFAVGTKAVADELVRLGRDNNLKVILGGGDTVAAVNQLVEDTASLKYIAHISTGGGASLEILEGKKLPGVEALKNVDPKMATDYTKGGYKQNGYGVPNTASIDGSHSFEGSQGYYSENIVQVIKDKNGNVVEELTGKEKFLRDVNAMKEFYKNRDIKYIVKTGIGGQHTPFQGITDMFAIAGSKIAGEYELGVDYATKIQDKQRELNATWDNFTLLPSSKSGSTDETMLIFVDNLAAFLSGVASENNIDGEAFASLVLNVLHDVNFKDGKELPSKELFKGFSLDLVVSKAKEAGIDVDYKTVQKIFASVLRNMVFETTPNPAQSRLAAFIFNSGLDKEVGEENVPLFISMFDNVGGRWTADLHMMTVLAYYDLDAEAFWQARRDAIEKVRKGEHAGNELSHLVLDNEYKHIALVVPDDAFWFGKSIEQNFNESIWQSGFANLVTVRESDWNKQQGNYDKANNPNRLVINLAGADISEKKFNVYKKDIPGLQTVTSTTDKEKLNNLALAFAEMSSMFYGMTNTTGTRLISRALAAKGFTVEDVDLNDLDNPATKIVQDLLFLRQPNVELGKGLLQSRLEGLQTDVAKWEAAGEKGDNPIQAAEKAIIAAAEKGATKTNVKELSDMTDVTDMKSLADNIYKSLEYAKANNRKFVPFIYLEGEKFAELRDYLIDLGIEWVLQGTGDQHISYQQVLERPEAYFPMIISMVPGKFIPGKPAIGFVKGYLDNISSNMVRDYFAEACYEALTDLRADFGGEGVFVRMIDTEKNVANLKQAAKYAYTGAVQALDLLELDAENANGIGSYAVAMLKGGKIGGLDPVANAKIREVLGKHFDITEAALRESGNDDILTRWGPTGVNYLLGQCLKQGAVTADQHVALQEALDTNNGAKFAELLSAVSDEKTIARTLKKLMKYLAGDTQYFFFKLKVPFEDFAKDYIELYLADYAEMNNVSAPSIDGLSLDQIGALELNGTTVKEILRDGKLKYNMDLDNLNMQAVFKGAISRTNPLEAVKGTVRYEIGQLMQDENSSIYQAITGDKDLAPDTDIPFEDLPIMYNSIHVPDGGEELTREFAEIMKAADINKFNDIVSKDYGLKEVDPNPAVTASNNILEQLQAMADRLETTTDDPAFTNIAATFKERFEQLGELIKNGEINPSIDISVSDNVSVDPTDIGRPLKVGVFATAGNPLHWAHLLTALDAMVEQKLDKMVFVIAGEDARKPDMLSMEERYPMNQEILDLFAPFFQFSPIASEPDEEGKLGLDGEYNVFRLLKNNPKQEMDAYYMVGSDHLNRYVEKNGKQQKDTVTKFEENLGEGIYGLKDENRAKQNVKAVFIARDAEEFKEGYDKVLSEGDLKNGFEIIKLVPSTATSSTSIRNALVGKGDPKALAMLPKITLDRIEAHDLYGAAAKKAKANILNQLQAMADKLKTTTADPAFTNIAETFEKRFNQLGELIQKGEINPSIDISVSDNEVVEPTDIGRPLKVGVFATAGNPLHWAHLLTALDAMVEQKLDKMVFVIAGEDARKPDMLSMEERYPMNQEILDLFAPFFQFSPIASEPDEEGKLGLDGEYNVFRLLKNNPKQEMDAYYMVGSDHLNRYVEKNGKQQKDTVTKFEENLGEGIYGLKDENRAKQNVKAVFIARDAEEFKEGYEKVLSEGDLKNGFEIIKLVPSAATSSTSIRNALIGKGDEKALAMLPKVTYDRIVDHDLYGSLVKEPRDKIMNQLEEMADKLKITIDDPAFTNIAATFEERFAALGAMIHKGEIDPSVKISLSSETSVEPTDIGRPLKVGVFATAGNPLHWAHLLTALDAMVEQKLDKMVFVIAGEDARKPDMLPVSKRYPMNKEVLALFAPFFEFSPIANEPDQNGKLGLDGEYNVFRLLQNNPKQEMDAYYMVGSDHLNRYVEKNGKQQKDTVTKFEENLAEGIYGLKDEGRAKQNVKAVFIARDAEEFEAGYKKVLSEGPLKNGFEIVKLVPSTATSSTSIRNALMGQGDEKALAMLPKVTYDSITEQGNYGTVPNNLLVSEINRQAALGDVLIALPSAISADADRTLVVEKGTVIDESIYSIMSDALPGIPGVYLFYQNIDDVMKFSAEGSADVSVIAASQKDAKETIDLAV